MHKKTKSNLSVDIYLNMDYHKKKNSNHLKFKKLKTQRVKASSAFCSGQKGFMIFLFAFRCSF